MGPAVGGRFLGLSPRGGWVDFEPESNSRGAMEAGPVRLSGKENCEPQAESSPGPSPEDKQVPHRGCGVSEVLVPPATSVQMLGGPFKTLTVLGFYSMPVPKETEM